MLTQRVVAVVCSPNYRLRTVRYALSLGSMHLHQTLVRHRGRTGLTWLTAVCTLVLASGCSSAPPPAAAVMRDRISYDTFVAAQSELLLDERGPSGQELTLRYTATGDPNDPALVLVHGVPSSSWMYRYVMERLAGQALYVVAVDNLGYGGSAKPQMAVDRAATFYAPDRQADRLGYLLDELGITEAGFVVHDVGGPIVWELLAQRPELASALVVLNTIAAPGGFSPPSAVDNPIVQAGMRIVGFEREATIRAIVCAMVAIPERIDTPVQLEGYYRPFRQGSELAYYSFLTNLDIVRNRIAGYAALIEQLDLPAAVLWGAEDEELLADPSLGWFAATLDIPQSRRVLVTEAKHLVAEEVPEQIAALAVDVMLSPAPVVTR